jgi:hypothetical protein
MSKAAKEATLLARVDRVVARRLHRITRLHLAGKLSAEQAASCTRAAESSEYWETVARLLFQFPNHTYGQALLAATRGQRPESLCD